MKAFRLVVLVFFLARTVSSNEEHQDNSQNVDKGLSSGVAPQAPDLGALLNEVQQTENILNSFVEHLNKGCEEPHSDDADVNHVTKSQEDTGAATNTTPLPPTVADEVTHDENETTPVPHDVEKRDVDGCDCPPGPPGKPGLPGPTGIFGSKGVRGDIGLDGPPGDIQWEQRRGHHRNGHGRDRDRHRHRDHDRHRGHGRHRDHRNRDKGDSSEFFDDDFPHLKPSSIGGGVNIDFGFTRPPTAGLKGERGDNGVPGLPGLKGKQGDQGTYTDTTIRDVEDFVREHVKATCTCKVKA